MQFEIPGGDHRVRGNRLSPGLWVPAAVALWAHSGCLQPSAKVSPAATTSETPRAVGAASTESSSTGQDASAAAPIDWADYGLLLYRTASGDQIRDEGLRSSLEFTDRMLKRLAERGPVSEPARFTDSSSRTAFYINTHNLVVLAEMQRVLMNSYPSPWPPTRLNARRWRIDGRDVTIHSLRSMALESSRGDWRVRLALFSGRGEGPGLWRRPVSASFLDAQLDEIVRTALKSARVVRINHGEYKQLQLCRELYEVRMELVSDYERRLKTKGATMLNVLLEWATPFDRGTLNSAVGYEIVRMPEDVRMPLDRPSATP